ncbi:MAG: hypothetical protein K2N70_06175 [Helicobacter sp.]|nr:hypothetical protein [Helicobacter sp.]
MSIFHSAASMLCLRLKHRRCALWLGLFTIMSNGKEMFRLRLNMTRFHVSLRASVTSVAINEQRIPSERSKTVDCFGQCPRNDKSQNRCKCSQ